MRHFRNIYFGVFSDRQAPSSMIQAPRSKLPARWPALSYFASFFLAKYRAVRSRCEIFAQGAQVELLVLRCKVVSGVRSCNPFLQSGFDIMDSIRAGRAFSAKGLREETSKCLGFTHISVSQVFSKAKYLGFGNSPIRFSYAYR